MVSTEKMRIVIADDHAVLRCGLRLLLEKQPDMEVVGEAESCEQAEILNLKLQPDIILMDLSLPVQCGDPNTAPAGLTAIKHIKAKRAEARILVLTMHDDPGYLREALEAGCAGYILKRAADTELLSAIRSVFQGGTFIHSNHARLLFGRKPAAKNISQADQAAFDSLSPREQEVLRLIALGYTNQQVADILSISVKTVETYKNRLMTKLGLTGRAALVRYALQQGLLQQKLLEENE